MAAGFKMGSAFVEVNTEDNTKSGRDSIGSTMMKWAGGLAVGATISKGITDNLDIGQANAKLAGQLNLTKEVADRAGKVSGQVYRDNFGESIPAVNEAIASVGTNMLNLNTASQESIKQITEAALGLASTFDQDVGEATRAAGVLVKTGLAKNGMEAMDLLTRAFQTGGNAAGDLLETVTEYAPQFAKLGFDGATALGVLSAGLKAGARDGDVMADVFKEFGLRAIDTAQLTTDGYTAIGLSADDMRAKVAAGGKGASDAMVQVLQALQNMKDPVAQNAAGVALFGTQWEDTLRAILPKMDLTEASLTDVAGATDKMNAATADSAKNGIESVKRQMEGWVQSMTNANGPLGDITSWALGFGGVAIPLVSQLATIAVGFNAIGWEAIGTSVKVVASWIAMAVASTANAIVMAAAWVAAFWPVALIVAAVIALVALIIMNWDTIKQWTINTWNAVWQWISDRVTDIRNIITVAVNWIVQRWDDLAAIPGKVGNWFAQVGTAAKQKLNELVDWIKGIPGRILGALGDLGNLLWNAGKRIIEGFLNGIKNAFNAVKNFVGGIGSWIADHKGPIEVDAVLLVPHGNAFMKGLTEGLEDGFETQVRPKVEGLAGRLADTTMPMPAVAFSSLPGSSAFGTDGASALDQPHSVHVENLNVMFPNSLNAMNKTELQALAIFLRDLLRNLDRAQRGLVTA
jgi:Phage-related minor tail protein